MIYIFLITVFSIFGCYKKGDLYEKTIRDFLKNIEMENYENASEYFQYEMNNNGGKIALIRLHTALQNCPEIFENINEPEVIYDERYQMKAAIYKFRVQGKCFDSFYKGSYFIRFYFNTELLSNKISAFEFDLKDKDLFKVPSDSIKIKKIFEN